MSPISPHKWPPLAANTQLAIDQSPNPEYLLSTQNVSRRSSNQSIKQTLMARFRANSMANLPRSSRVGSQQFGIVLDQDGQSGVGLPFDNEFDATQWDLNDPAMNDFFDFDQNTYGDNSHGLTQVPSGSSLQDQLVQASSSQEQQIQAPNNPTFETSGVIDPALLAQQPRDTDDFGPKLLATPGLTAIPGANEFLSAQLMQYQQLPMYPDPLAVYQPLPLPYFFAQSYQQSGYTPIEQQLTQQPVPKILITPQKSNKRARSDLDSKDDTPIIKRQRLTQQAKDTSEDESDNYKVAKPTGTRKSERARRMSRDSCFSSSSSLGKPNKLVVAHTGERPQKCEDKPWIRINYNTKGETTRTARINGEANELRKYKSKPLPHGDWNSRKFQFEYFSHGGLDEFKKKKMTARQIMEYITQYPSDDLRLWVQVSPADMARRYGSPGHSKCLFENCPKHIWGDSGTIDVGHYRVAFDEKYKTYGNKVVDPFDCPGFVHLYCLERFCDFEAICQVADVQVDTRVDLPREAGQAKWTMSGRPELELAQYFLKACKKDMLRKTEAFEHYPSHVSSSAPKQFDRTLVNALAEVNVATRTRSQMRQFVDRKLTPNVLMISKGDMEIAMTQKKIKASKVYKKAIKSKRATAATFNFEALYDEYDPVINTRIAKYRKLKAKFNAEDAVGLASKKSKSKATNKRKMAVRDDDSDSEPDLGNNNGQDSDIEELDDYQHAYPSYPQQQQNTRSSPRKRQRINYVDEYITYAPLPPPQHPQPQQLRAPQQLAQPQRPQSPYIEQGYTPIQSIRKPSASALFPRDYTHDIEKLQQPSPNEPPLTQDEFDEFMHKYQSLQRRKSSTLSNGPLYAGVMKARSPRSPARSPEFRKVMAKAARQASFNKQPVTSSKEFAQDDPPSLLVATPTTGARRSSRLASKSTSSIC